MRSAATFLKTGANPEAVTLGDIERTGGEYTQLTLAAYDDNVTCKFEYIYFSEAESLKYTDGEIPHGWYLRLADGEPDFDSGLKNDVALPIGQGCVIDSSSSEATYTSKGLVDTAGREFNILAGSRKMMGNFLPRSITLGELKRTTGEYTQLTFCTYDNNVTCTGEYVYFSEEESLKYTDGEIPHGWYLRLEDGEPDFDSGLKDELELPSGQGFVADSSSDEIMLQFPKAM